ncbi:MAG: hypothetical protein SGJ20_20165 [Planctomycetota bacterium]|nr:hypothetical protein [Planctomycetota bacterium]
MHYYTFLKSLVAVALLGLVLPLATGEKLTPRSANAQGANAQVAAEKAPAAANRADSAKARDAVNAITPAEEQEAQHFVELHHRELLDVLKQLKRMDRKEYRKAVRELFDTSEHFSTMQQKDPARYSLSLELWKVRSRIRLLTARASLSDNKDYVDELRKELLQEVAAQKQVVAMDLQRTESRARKLKATQQRLESEGDSKIETQLNKLTREIEQARRNRIPASAAKPNSDKQLPVQQ